MAILTITSVNPLYGNPVTKDTSGSSYTQRFQVLFNTASNTASAKNRQLAEAIAIDANGIPVINQSFRLNRNAFCRSKSASARQEGETISVVVTCMFSTKGTDEQDQEDSPLNKAPDISWIPVFEREAVLNARIIKVFQNGVQIGKDIQGKVNRRVGKLAQINNFSEAITNSFGDVPNPVPEVDVPYLQWNIVQNLANFDVGQAELLLQTVNVKAFKLAGETIREGRNLLQQRSGVLKYHGTGSYWEVTTTGLLKQTHDAQLTDNGAHQYIANSQVFLSGIDEGTRTKRNGKFAVRRLNGKGRQLRDKEKSVFLHFGIYEAQDHSKLNLPQNLLEAIK